MVKIKIVVYSTCTGKSPFYDWQKKLQVNTRAIVRSRLDRVELGNFGDCKPIKGERGLWELRIDVGPGYRIYYGKKGNDVVILLVAGSKSSQVRDIMKAKHYWLEYKELSDE